MKVADLGERLARPHVPPGVCVAYKNEFLSKVVPQELREEVARFNDEAPRTQADIMIQAFSSLGNQTTDGSGSRRPRGKQRAKRYDNRHLSSHNSMIDAMETTLLHCVCVVTQSDRQPILTPVICYFRNSKFRVCRKKKEKRDKGSYTEFSMDVLQLLTEREMKELHNSFGTSGLSIDQFVDCLCRFVEHKAKTTNDPTMLDVWNRRVFKNLFRDIDVNNDGTVTHDEFTNFSINSSLKGISIRQKQLDFQFGAYSLLEEPKAFVCGEHSVTDHAGFGGRSPFELQSAQHLALKYLPSPRLFVCQGYSRITVHRPETPACIATLESPDGGIINDAYYTSHNMLLLSTRSSRVDVYDATEHFRRRKSLLCDKSITTFLTGDAKMGTLPSHLGGCGDTNGSVFMLNFEKLGTGPSSSIEGTIGSVISDRRKLHTGQVTSMHYIEQISCDTICSSSLDNTINFSDAETGVVKFYAAHGHKEGVSGVTVSNSHGMGISYGRGESVAYAFSVDYHQVSPFCLEDAKDPHVNKLIGAHAVAHSHQIITLDAGGVAKLWDCRQMRCIRSFCVPQLEVNSSSTSKKKVRSGITQKPTGFSGQSSKMIVQLSQEFDLVQSLVYCEANRRIICVGKETTMFEYQANSAGIASHAEPLLSVQYNPLLQMIVSCTAAELRTWSIQTGCCDVSIENPLQGKVELIKSTITCMGLDAVYGKRVMLGTDTGHIACVLLSTGAVEWTFQVRENTPIQFVECTDVRRILVGAKNGLLFVIFEAEQETQLASKVIHEPLSDDFTKAVGHFTSPSSSTAGGAGMSRGGATTRLPIIAATTAATLPGTPRLGARPTDQPPTQRLSVSSQTTRTAKLANIKSDIGVVHCS